MFCLVLTKELKETLLSHPDLESFPNKFTNRRNRETRMEKHRIRIVLSVSFGQERDNFWKVIGEYNESHFRFLGTILSVQECTRLRTIKTLE